MSNKNNKNFRILFIILLTLGLILIGIGIFSIYYSSTLTTDERAKFFHSTFDMAIAVIGIIGLGIGPFMIIGSIIGLYGLHNKRKDKLNKK